MDGVHACVCLAVCFGWLVYRRGILRHQTLVKYSVFSKQYLLKYLPNFFFPITNAYTHTVRPKVVRQNIEKMGSGDMGNKKKLHHINSLYRKRNFLSILSIISAIANISFGQLEQEQNSKVKPHSRKLFIFVLFSISEFLLFVLLLLFHLLRLGDVFFCCFFSLSFRYFRVSIQWSFDLKTK